MGDFTDIEQRAGRYYAERLAQHGLTPKGVDWNSPDAQSGRFEELTRILDPDVTSQILDWGCGYGALVDFLDARGVSFTWQGYDVAPEMVEAARKHLAGDERCTVTADAAELAQADYVIASGVFSVRGDVDDDTWLEYIHATLDRFAALSRRGFACNFLTSHSDPGRMEPQLYYADPAALLDWCAHRFGRRVAVVQDTPVWEFTLRVRPADMDELVTPAIVRGTQPGPDAKPVVVVGAGDAARCIAVYLQHDGGRDVACFAVHEQYRELESLLGRDVVALEQLTETHPPAQFDVLVATGYGGVNARRATLVEGLRGLGYAFATYVSPRAQVAPHVTIGANCVVYEDNVLQPFVTVGDDVVLWSGNHIGHDVTIGDHCFIASHVVLSGRVALGERCFVGVNATFRDGVTVAPQCIIGAGAIVMGDIEEPGSVLATRSTPAIEKRSWDLNF